jgi:macrolide transport system ATP-binding/permease protein
MKTCDYRQEENFMELILKAKDIRVEFKERDVLDIEELEIYDYVRIPNLIQLFSIKTAYSLS